MAESETMSVDTSNEAQEDPLQDLPTEKLLEMVEEITHSNQALDIETQMFENFLKRIEPKEAVKDGVVAVAQVSTAQETLAAVGRLGARKRSKSRSGHADRMLRLTAEQKCDVAQREIEELKQEMSSFEEDSEKILDTYRAVMEEAEIRLAEIKKSSYEFDRDIVKGAVNAQTGKVVAERVERYFDDKHRARETLIEKLRLKNSTLKVQINKLHMQLKQKEEMGEVLHEVDFNQLKIENSQYLEKIEERNSDLLRLKQMATNTVQVLNSFKKKLHVLTLESDRLKSEISSRNELLTRIDAETAMVEEERQKAEHINRKYRGQLSDYQVPEVMEYVSEKAGLYELQKKVRSWERKVDIADMALKTHRKTWNTMKVGQQEV